MKPGRTNWSPLMIVPAVQVALIVGLTSSTLAYGASKGNDNPFYISDVITRLHHQPNLEAQASDSLSNVQASAFQDSASDETRNGPDLITTVANDDGPESASMGGGPSETDADLGNGGQSEQESSPSHASDGADGVFIERHKSPLQVVQDLFERRYMNNPHQLSSSQELSPISIGLDPVSGMAGPPFPLAPFSVPNNDPSTKPQVANADNLDQGLGPAMPFGLGPLPHLLGFQNTPFDGPQRGDQSAHSNYHATVPSPDSEASTGQKTWPKIFRFTDGRINLSDFEKQKKIRLGNKNHHNSENHIESAPIMFDGRQLKRKSFLILHGGIFSR